MIRAVHAAELLVPNVLGASQHNAGEIGQLFLLWIETIGRLLLRTAWTW
jgi:hypothetical protein